MTTTKYNFVLIGSRNAGKTALLKRFENENSSFSNEYKPTLTLDLRKRNFKDNEFTLWDTSGDEHYREIAITQAKNSHAIMLVFNYTDKSTFDALPELIETLKPLNKPMYLLGTHHNEGQAVISKQDILSFLQKYPNFRGDFDVTVTNGPLVSGIFDDILQEFAQREERKVKLTAFRDKHLLLAKNHHYPSVYAESINTFYKEGLAILDNNDTEQEQNFVLQDLAHKTFKHRKGILGKILLDALVFISSLFGVGVCVLAKHKSKYGTLFYSTAPTDREVEIKELFSNSPAA